MVIKLDPSSSRSSSKLRRSLDLQNNAAYTTLLAFVADQFYVDCLHVLDLITRTT